MERTGQVTAMVALRVTVRDLDALDDLRACWRRAPDLNVHGVTWHVDWDNPAWPQVRAAAIGAAIGKARDYAAAAGCYGAARRAHRRRRPARRRQPRHTNWSAS